MYTRIRENLREVNWLETFLACIIQRFTVLTWDQSFVVFCSSFLSSKGVSCALFVMASSSTPQIFTS